MLREAFTERLRRAMKAKDARTVSTLRLVLAELKQRDVAARGQGHGEGIAEPEIGRMLQAMIKQRRDAIALYEQGKRPELAAKEREEIAIIEGFLPRQLNAAETEQAAKAAIAETGASGVRDMGKVMALLRERHAGSIDFAEAGAIVKRLLA